MADYTGFLPSSATVPAGRSRYSPGNGLNLSAGGTSTTTYYYRTTAGARGSTTSVASIPAGAVVLRAVTS